MNHIDPAIYAVASRAVDIADAIFIEAFGRDLQRRPKGDRDYALSVDDAIQSAVGAFLSQETPEIAFLAEEDDTSHDSGSLIWSLDPLDGTVNYSAHLPLCGISLALIDEYAPLLGVVSLPALGERYESCQDGSARRNGAVLRVQETQRLQDAIVVVGDFAIGKGSHEKNVVRTKLLGLLSDRALRVRMLGSAAMDLAWLASGAVHAAITLWNNPWDHAAGAAIARSAGATIGDAEGASYRTNSDEIISAASPELFLELCKLIRFARSEQP